MGIQILSKLENYILDTKFSNKSKIINYNDTTLNALYTYKKSAYNLINKIGNGNSLSPYWKDLSKLIDVLILLGGNDFITTIYYPTIRNIYTHEILHYHKILGRDDNICTISNSMAYPYQMIMYQKFINYSYNKNKLTIVLENWDNKKNASKKDTAYVNRDSRPYINILGNIDYNKIHTVIDEINVINKNNMMDFIIIEILDEIIDEMSINIICSYTLFPRILSYLIISLNILKKGGKMLMVIDHIVNKSIYEFYNYIGSFFDTTKVIFPNKNPGIGISFYLFDGYNGNIEIDILYDLYIIVIENIVDNVVAENDIEILKKVGTVDRKIITSKEHKILKKIIDNNIDDKWEIYQEHIINEFNMNTEMTQHLFTAYLDKNIYNNMEYEAKISAILYAYKIGLPIADWVKLNENKKKYYHIQMNYLANSVDPYIFRIHYPCRDINISLNKKLINLNDSILMDLDNVGENTYSYIDSTNKLKRQKINYLINREQKNLEHFLKLQYNITMNGTHVSRAWIKLYELYASTGYLDNLVTYSDKNASNNITAFHVCEAPGNFISVSIYYAETILNKNYVWNGQSLVISNISDHYNFIKKNEKNWDTGVDNSGDILRYNNIEYYYKKYEGVDSFVGDCGMKWVPNINLNENTHNMQLVYALLLPRVGGNFIIKSYSVNYDIQFISLLYIITCKYEKVNIYKSSINFWSPEIYVMGIGKKNLEENEIKEIMKIAKALTINEMFFPVSEISDMFIMEYEYINNIVVNSYSAMKKFLVYIIEHESEYNKNIEQLKKILNEKNIYWVGKYMTHLDDAPNKYRDYMLNKQ